MVKKNTEMKLKEEEKRKQKNQLTMVTGQMDTDPRPEPNRP
jgi:hypothetical protein